MNESTNILRRDIGDETASSDRGLQTPSVILLRLFLLAGFLHSFDVSAADIVRESVDQAPLKLLPKETPQPAYGVVPPERISGRVVLRSQEKIEGAEGVSVTDGYSVAKTDAQGNYELKPNPAAVFVAVHQRD